MASTVGPLTSDEYDRLYGHEAGWEFQDGQANRKPVPTYLHGILAALLSELLRLAGYIASVEADVRLNDRWTPRPDACGVLAPVKGKYPVSVDVVCEVLSENEDILEKCRNHQATGAVGQIFAFDFDSKSISTWNGDDLVPIIDLLLGNGGTITGGRIWRELEARETSKLKPPSSMMID